MLRETRIERKEREKQEKRKAKKMVTDHLDEGSNSFRVVKFDGWKESLILKGEKRKWTK